MAELRKYLVAALMATTLWLVALPASVAAASPSSPTDVLRGWYHLIIELVRHTPTYSPPVASRAFAYLGVTAFEAAATGSPELQSLAGQLNGLSPLPKLQAGLAYDEAVVLEAALADAATAYFDHTGPTGQRALSALKAKLDAAASANVAPDVVQRSKALGLAIAAHILEWSKSDGGATVENLGFPLTYQLTAGSAHWVPTNLIALQQAPLLPGWGNNRPFSLPMGTACGLPPPPAYSEDTSSEFYRQALEVATIAKNLTDDQRAIARFWSDDPMLSPTPPGHWISIGLQILERDDASLSKSADVLARIGIAEADAFIGCWQTKFQYDLLRPVTYIHRLIDPKFEPLLITPPFPEYPSGHSTQSAAAATVLTAIFGENFAFVDDTHKKNGLKPRSFTNFWAAAEEAALSRLYGGIHFRAAIERGLEQGRCIGKHVVALKTWK